MTSVKRILNKAVLPFALAMVLSGASGFFIINASAATCVSGDGKYTCTGECCSSGPSGCAAYPCPRPAPVLPDGGGES